MIAMFTAIYWQHYQEPDIGNPKALITPPPASGHREAFDFSHV